MDKKSAEEIYDMFLAFFYRIYENPEMRNQVEKLHQRHDVLTKQHGIIDGGKLAFVEWMMERF